MNAVHINTVLTEITKIAKEYLEVDLAVKEKSLKNAPVTTEDITIIIGVVGSLSGSVFFSMNNETAKKVASKMAFGMEFDEVDELCKSAIGELGNICMGNVATAFSEKELPVNIAPPVTIEGAGTKISSKSSPLLSLVLGAETGEEIVLDVSLDDTRPRH